MNKSSNEKLKLIKGYSCDPSKITIYCEMERIENEKRISIN